MSEELDLYEFSPDHIGRKRYVSVRGHSKSVPAYKTYRGTDGRNHIHPDFGGTWDGLGNESAYVMPDKLAYTSPIDGSRVESRSAHSEHCKRHGVVESGDLKIGDLSRNRDNRPLDRAGRDVVRAMQELSSR